MKYRSVSVASVIAALLIAPVKADERCAALSAKLSTLDLKKGAPFVSSRVGKPYKELYAECDSGNTFEGKNLPSHNGRPLKCSTDPNRAAFVLKFPDGTVLFRSKMGVDADGSPASKLKNPKSTDQPETSLRYDEPRGESVNAEEVSFVVVPQTQGPYRSAFTADSGIGLGDLAVVIKNGRCSFGVVADQGPVFRIGEASLKAHEDLGNPQCKVPGEHPCLHIKAGGSGVGIGQDVTFLVFPNSRPSPLTGRTVSSVAEEGGSRKASLFLGRYQ